jgi:drug/metabolite transporter (DMT)-like permease
MALASALFSVMTILARVSAGAAPWMMVASVRAWVGVLVALAVARAAGHPVRVRGQRVAWGRSLFGCAGLGLSFYAMGQEAIPVGDIATLRATVPILVALLAALFLRERPPRVVWGAVPLAFAGIVLLVKPTFEVTGGLAALTLLGCCASAGAMVFLRRMGPGESPEAVAIHFGVVAGVLMTGAAWASSAPLRAEGWLPVLGCGLAGGLGQLCMTRAYAREKAAAVSAMGYLAVVLTHVLAFAVLEEPLGAMRAAGAGLVVLAGLVLAFGPRLRATLDRGEAVPATPPRPDRGGPISRRGG